MADFYTFLKEDYGTFVGYVCAGVAGIIIGVFALKILLKEMCGIEFCVGAHHRRHRNRAAQEAEDAALAERMQRELEEEERQRVLTQKRKVRREKMKILLADVTMTVKDEYIHCGREDDADVETTIYIPAADGANKKRREPCHCAVCLAEYEAGDTVIWSLNADCRHVFHDDCILTWLSRGKRRCPCCRKSFVDTAKETPDSAAVSGEVPGPTAPTSFQEGGGGGFLGEDENGESSDEDLERESGEIYISERRSARTDSTFNLSDRGPVTADVSFENTEANATETRTISIRIAQV